MFFFPNRVLHFILRGSLPFALTVIENKNYILKSILLKVLQNMVSVNSAEAKCSNRRKISDVFPREQVTGLDFFVNCRQLLVKKKEFKMSFADTLIKCAKS